MLRIMLRGSAVTLAALVLLIARATSADEFQPEEGYQSLFNGKDFTGWHYKGSKEALEGKTETSDKRFEVAGGVIRANEGKGIKDLYTLKDFNGPFHLKLQFRAGLKADSGVYIRGKQLQVRDYPRFGGDYSKVPGFKLDDWNDLDITVGPEATVATVNGKKLADSDVFELSVKDGKAAAKLNGTELAVAEYRRFTSATALCKNNGEVLEAAFPVPSQGGIGLQAELGKFEFRRIRVKELKGK
jgi:hypothetical protein